MLIQKRAKLKRTWMQQAWTEKISLAFDFQRFQGATGIGPYMSLLTNEQEQRKSSFNSHGSQIFPSQIINEEQSSRSISPKFSSSIAAAAQNKKQYETLIKKRRSATCR